jgi:hypothetical protein
MLALQGCCSLLSLEAEGPDSTARGRACLAEAQAQTDLKHQLR